MSNSTHTYGATLADVNFSALKQAASAERAEAVKRIGRAVAAWLRGGLELRYLDDAVTHPAAGKPCGC